MKILSFLLLLLLAFPGMAQKKLRTVEVSDTIAHAFIDRGGDLYLITRHGQLQKYDRDGHLSVLLKTHVQPTLFDPRDGARLFAYYRNSQHYEYLSPSFEVTKAYSIDSSFVIQPWLICPSGDHKLWVLDAADHSLKKINPRDSEVEIEVSIDSTLIKDARIFETMREYQGFVFLYDPLKGILVFNGMGKHIRTIEAKGIRSFNFLGEELYFVQNGALKFFDLFSAEFRETPQELKGGDILLTDIRLFHIYDRKVDIYVYAP
jgi:hypothetical protein